MVDGICEDPMGSYFTGPQVQGSVNETANSAWTLIWQAAPLIFCPLVALAGLKTTTDGPPSL